MPGIHLSTILGYLPHRWQMNPKVRGTDFEGWSWGCWGRCWGELGVLIKIKEGSHLAFRRGANSFGKSPDQQGWEGIIPLRTRSNR